VGQDDAASSGAGGGIWKPPENRLLAALPMRQPCLAAAIQGHEVGRSVLDDDKVASSFFLCVRIFCRVAAATKSPAQPSGFVPG
jgi:hypothetical protein